MSPNDDTDKKHKLDNPQRREMLPPGKTLQMLGLQEGDIIADIGCGIGYFSIPAAEIVGDSGRVFGLDLSVEMIEELDHKIETNNLQNIRTIITGEDDLKLCDESVNFAFIANVLHELNEIPPIMKEVRRILKNHGKIVVLEWKKAESDYGPPIEHRIANDLVVQLLQQSGFKNINQMDIEQHFYAVVGEK